MILVVDDNPTTLQIIRKWLQNAKIPCVVLANSPQLAISIYNCNKDAVKVIITDIMFPLEKTVENGILLIAYVRVAEKDANVEEPCFIIGCSGNEKFESEVYRAKGNVFLRKPVNKDQLIDLVRNHYSQ